MTKEELKQAILSTPRKWSGPNSQGEYMGLCPFHDDHDPSLSVNFEKGAYLCFACGSSGPIELLAKRLGIALPDSERGEPIAEAKGLTLAEYAQAKGFPIQFLKSLGIGQSKGHLEIPYCNEAGEVKAVRRRWGLGGSLRFTLRKGDKLLPYGLDRLSEAKEKGYIILAEGETDTITLWLHSLPALGIPGATSWQTAWSKYLEGIAEIYLARHQDQAGEVLAQKVGESFPNRLKVIHLADAKDVNDLYLADRRGFIERFQEAFSKASIYSPLPAKEPLTKEVEEASPEQRQEAERLLTSPDLVDRFLDVVSRLGQVGEENNCVMVLLAAISRLTESPISLTIKGESSSGKNALLQRVLSLFPASQVYMVSRLTPQALFYLRDKDLKHKILGLTEAGGGEAAEYGVRLMLSEKELTIWAPAKDPQSGRASTEEIHIPGPIALLQTTTKAQLSKELETRYFSIYSDSSEPLTKLVLERQAKEYEGDAPVVTAEEVKIWQIALGMRNTWEVIIPFAREIIPHLPTAKVRIRRDARRLMELVKASALLHQRQRQIKERDGGQVIMAAPEDYTLAYRVASAVFAQTYKELSQTLQDFLKTLTEKLDPTKKESFKAKDAAKATNTRLRTAQRRLEDLEIQGYVEILESGRGKPNIYSLSGETPEELSLPLLNKSSGTTPAVAVSHFPHPDTKPPPHRYENSATSPLSGFVAPPNPDNPDTSLTHPFPDTGLISEEPTPTPRQGDSASNVLGTPEGGPRSKTDIAPAAPVVGAPPPPGGKPLRLYTNDGEPALAQAEYLGELIYVALDDDWAKKAPPGFVVYTLAEMKELGGKPEAMKRFVHEAKKQGGKVVDGGEVKNLGGDDRG